MKILFSVVFVYENGKVLRRLDMNV